MIWFEEILLGTSYVATRYSTVSTGGSYDTKLINVDLHHIGSLNLNFMIGIL
jgi:hypothetical protein